MDPFRVVRLQHPIDPAFDERLRREPGVSVAAQPLPRDADEARAALGTADVYHVHSARDEVPECAQVTEALLLACPRLLAVSTFGAGYDSVDVGACSKAGVLVMNQRGANKESVAEHAIGLMLAVLHRIGESDRALRGPRPDPFTRESLMGREAHGRVLGIVGIGEIGTRVAQMARAAFGMEVLAVDPYVDAGEVARRGAAKVELDELLARSDVVSLHCPRDAATMNLMDGRRFSQMKRGAAFVTTARGGIHDEVALARALASGHLSGAGLDVWQPEPPAANHPLLAMPNVVATYHTAGVTHEARRNIAVMGSEQIVQLLRGERPPRLVNPEAWEPFRARFEKRRGGK